jgi:hypothetical protein
MVRLLGASIPVVVRQITSSPNASDTGTLHATDLGDARPPHDGSTEPGLKGTVDRSVVGLPLAQSL